MTRRLAAFATLVIACIVCGAIMYRWHASRLQAAASTFYETALEQNHISVSVTADKQSFRITDGHLTATTTDRQRFDTLRTAYALAAERRSPILSLEGTDPDALDASIAELERARDDLAAVQSNAAESRIVRTSLYPIAFLEAASRLERARQTFLASGRDTDERTYERELTNAITAYESDLRSFRRAFSSVVPIDTKKLGVAGGRVLSRESELAAIDGLLGNADTLAARAASRERCIAGAVSACDAGDTALPTVMIPADAGGNYDQAASILNLLGDAAGLPPEKRVRDVVDIAESSCVGSSSSNHMFELRAEKNAAGARFQALTYVGDILLIKASTFTGTPYFDFFRSHDVSYVPYWPVSTYTCPEIGSDTALAIAIANTRMVASSTPFSASLASENKIAKTEAALTKNNNYSERDAAAYLGAVRDELAASNTLNNVADAYTSLAIQMRDRSAGLSDIVNRLAVEIETNVRYIHSDYPVELGAPYLFFARSAFFSLYLGDNRSVTGDGTRKPYETGTLLAAQEPYTPYSSIKDSVSMTKILHDVGFAVQLEQPVL